MPYKAIIFDLDNTLLNYTASELQSMQYAISHHRLTELQGFEWDQFWTRFGPINWNYWISRTEAGMTIGQVLEFSFRDTLMEMKLEHSLAHPLAQTYWSYFCELGLLEEGAAQLLGALHGQYKLSIISNGIGDAQRKRLAAGGIDHYFGCLHVSDEVGYWKPDIAIFQSALTSLQVEPSEALFVGDSLTDDYEGAIRSGIDFCLYNPGNRQLEQHIRPKHTIKQLNELLTVIK